MLDEQLKELHWPGVKPGSTAWKAAMLTVTPPVPPCVESGRIETLLLAFCHDRPANYLG